MSPMSPRLLRPSATGFHPEANSWRTRVIANGGSVSATTLAAVSKFCRDIDAAGIRDRFYRLNLLAGTGLNAALVPLYRGQSRTGMQFGNTTDTNSGPFVSGDYAETGGSGGLVGNGTSKQLLTGVTQNDLPLSTGHYFGYSPTITSVATIERMIGSSGVYFGYLFNGQINVNWGSSSAITVNAQAGSLLWQRESATLLRVYNNGSLVSTNTTSASPTGSTDQILVFNNAPGPGGQLWRRRLSAYSFGLDMTSAQVASFHTAMATFQSALSRSA